MDKEQEEIIVILKAMIKEFDRLNYAMTLISNQYIQGESASFYGSGRISLGLSEIEHARDVINEYSNQLERKTFTANNVKEYNDILTDFSNKVKDVLDNLQSMEDVGTDVAKIKQLSKIIKGVAQRVRTALMKIFDHNWHDIDKYTQMINYVNQLIDATKEY